MIAPLTATVSFVDTNVLVYSADPGAGDKHEIAIHLIGWIALQSVPDGERSSLE